MKKKNQEAEGNDCDDYIYLSNLLYDCLFLSYLFQLSIYLCIFISNYLFTHPSVYLLICLSILMSTYLSIYL